MLVRLGLPDTKGWKYVKSGGGTYRFGSLNRVIEGWNPTGDSWVELEKDADGIRRSTADGLTLWANLKVETQDENAEASRKLSSRGVRQDYSYGEGGAEIEGDEAADAAALVEGITKALGDERKRRSLLGDAELLSGLFFRAAHWHRRGLTEPAARLVGGLMENMPRKSALLEVSIGRIANERQTVALMRFDGTGDWKLLESDLETALKDFPRFWPERPLAERLLGSVQARVSGVLRRSLRTGVSADAGAGRVVGALDGLPHDKRGKRDFGCRSGRAGLGLFEAALYRRDDGRARLGRQTPQGGCF